MQMESIQGIENCDMDIDYFADVPLKYIGLGRSNTTISRIGLELQNLYFYLTFITWC